MTEIMLQKHRADVLAATIRELRDVATSDYESKEEFISRVRNILSADPDERLTHSIRLDGWIDAEKTQPPLISGEDYSENVWGWDGGHILVVSFFIDSDGWNWANAYGNVFGDADFDDDYDIKYWQPIAIPLPPNA